MGKQLNIYRGYTTGDMKTRADIPTAANISEQTGYIDCTNISLAAVKNLLGASTYSLYDICRHANINKWSGFSPKVLSVASPGMSGEIAWAHPSTYKLGDFAGYNHGAITPAYYSTTHDDTVYVATDAESVTVEVQFDLGELILTNINSAMGIALAVFNGSTYVTNATRALSTLTDQCRASNSRAFTVYVTGPSGSSSWDNIQSVTYTFKLFLLSGTTYSYNTNEIAKLFHVELPQFNKIINKQFPTIAHSSLPAGYTMSYLDYTYNIGLLSLIVAKNTGSANVNIVATIYEGASNQISATTIYTGYIDTAGVTISNYNIGTLAQYNYHIQVSVNPY